MDGMNPDSHPVPRATEVSTSAAAERLERLERLEAFLRDDPQNDVLLADAFETALQAGAFERAEFHLRHAQALQGVSAAWGLREAHWLMAQGRSSQARAALERLEHLAGTDPALRTAIHHDLAFIAWREGDHERGLARLREALSPAGGLPSALQAQWLRLLHAAGRPEEASRWAAQQLSQGHLGAHAAGIAALAALDAGDHTAALRWSDHALQHGAPSSEALVASASMALARRNSRLARQRLQQALEHRGDDGRVWSALGYCEMLDGRFGEARQAFDRATATMPGHVGTWHGKGWAALAQGDLPDAHRAFEQALVLDRNFAESHGAKAVVQAMAGNAVAARESIERAQRLDPASLAPRFAQAVLEGEVRDVAALRAIAQRLLGSRSAPLGGSMAQLIGLINAANDGEQGEAQ